jgi:hypothetical protein
MSWIRFLSYVLVTLPVGEGGRGERELGTASYRNTAKKSAFEGLVGDGCGFWEIQNSDIRVQ